MSIRWGFIVYFFSFFILQTLRFVPCGCKLIKPNPHLQFPCNAQYDSYPFCNTSIPIAKRAQSLISLLTLEEKVQRLSNNASSIPRLGIPAYEWWSESLHGIATNGPGINFNGTIPSATSFPQVLVTVASFNRSLWHSIASAIATEARAMYNMGQAGLTFWAPNINIFRDPRWGRGQETPGEDPMVASVYAFEFVRGFQGQNSKAAAGELRGDSGTGDGLMLSACCKHFIAYDLDKWKNFSRYSFNAVVTKQDMEDTYQPPFHSCIQHGKASCLMCSYNQINGVPACALKDLFQKVRTDWGFKGYITSDCDAVATIYEYQNYTKTAEDAVALALKAGTDINCGTYMLRHARAAIQQGKLEEEDIDRALLNLFQVQLRLGLYDGDPATRQFGKLGPQDVCISEHRRLALEAARQGIVLLKNDKKLLPLNKDGISSLAIIGPLANNTSKMGGGYSGIPCRPKGILGGLEAHVKKVYYAAGCLDTPCSNSSGFMEAIAIAREAEFVIIVAGLDSLQETEDHDRSTLLLPGLQMTLVNTITAVSKNPLVLLLTGGGPLDVSFANKDPRIGSILWIGYPGEAGAEAVADVIFGDYNPGGRLPMTWYPETFTNIPMDDMDMRADPSRGYPGRTYRFYTGDIVYGFGHGLSYTNFTYKILAAPSELSLPGFITRGETGNSRPRQRGDGLDYFLIRDEDNCDSLKFNVHISVTNTGDMDGSTVAMLFSRAPKHFKGAPAKQLVGFNRVHTASHKSTKTSISVDPCRHLTFANEDGHRILPLGDNTLMFEDLEHVVSIQT